MVEVRMSEVNNHDYNLGFDDGLALAKAKDAELAEARAAIRALCRVLGPVNMTLAERECIDEPLPREDVIFSFMGSGASDHVTVGEFEDAMKLARQALAGKETP
jgi:hypothetical protein